MYGARSYRYQRINVFTDVPFSGKPLAVFTRAAGLTKEEMQRIAREMRADETAFLLPTQSPDCDYRVLRFSANVELYTQHSSVGAAFALACEAVVAAKKSRVVFEAQDGAISVSTTLTPLTTVSQAQPMPGAIYNEPSVLPALLGLREDDLISALPARAYSAGVPFLVVPVASTDALQRVALRRDIWERTLQRFEAPALAAVAVNPGENAQLAVRVFVPQPIPIEDAATELAAGPVVQYAHDHQLMRDSQREEWIIEQGAGLDRPSRIYVYATRAGNQLNTFRVGGECVRIGEGDFYL